MRRFLLAVALTVTSSPVWAQQVKIAFHDGQVSVDSAGASPRAILAEWSKVGGTNIVNAERVTGAPLTLKLVDVPESQALEIILRSVAGYMAAPRGRTPGASLYDRILVLPTSTAVVAGPAGRPSSGSPSFGAAMGTQRFVPPRPQPVAIDEAPPEPEEPAEQPQSEPVFTFPQPAQQNNYRSVQPVQLPQLSSDAPGLGNVPAGGMPTFGVTGAPVPGMIQQAPQQQPQQPAAPVRPTRPPGQ